MSCYSYLDSPASADDMDSKNAQVIVDHIRPLYDQGVPFFSRGTFQEVVRQLDHCRASPCPPALAQPPVDSDDPDSDGQDRPVISLPAIDGIVVQTRLKTGLVKPGDKKNTEFVLYVGIQTAPTSSVLTSCHDPPWN